ncbi:hypothetical protein PACTADRAFT_48274 [Pachysolen tannophilus NRRL Y-2460]|uniref:Amino-acid acetyltransferase, mitochondrial n=1 Tax=Pachysolen tannophilus NRRL Y-2460 TaxID=669874 RepID=A0A1E4U3G5_PACTA|nr:hypothetical protein PACTADRAFT_48274 [Pachysolen tannophilus NRRL Y-2460]
MIIFKGIEPRFFRIWYGGCRRAFGISKNIHNFRSNLEKSKQTTNERRELILSILKSTSGKREARNYLKKYSLLRNVDEDGGLLDSKITYGKVSDFENFPNDNEISNNNGNKKNKYDKIVDNLINIDIERKDQQNGFGKQDNSITHVKIEETSDQIELNDILRVAIIKIRDFEKLSQEIINGICLTIYNIVRLGVSPIIVIDNSTENSNSLSTSPNFSQSVKKIAEQSNLLVKSIESLAKSENHSLEARSIFGLFEIDTTKDIKKIVLPELLVVPLTQGIIPIVNAVAYNLKNSTNTILSMDDVLKILVKDLIQVNNKVKESNNDGSDFLTIEKIIFIDPEGGIPSIERFKSSHVYINLLQEYESIISELNNGFLQENHKKIHLNNLNIIKELLDISTESTTGLITTPRIATLKVGTKFTNPIIHNVLTDRPIISSSLPVNLKKTPLLNTTIIRKGLPLKIIVPQSNIEEGIDLLEYDKRGIIDLKKLKSLVNDSFQRELDLKHYLNRINGKVASLIIAGDYDGAAIITLESPSFNEKMKIPYLDKFAVSTKSQGSSGVADIVFKCMLNKYPQELLWRSKKKNPVNKWYFERSKGNLNIENSEWKVFYSGNKTRSIEDFKAYFDICENIEPSWLNKELNTVR